jgi:hypothetical protein
VSWIITRKYGGSVIGGVKRSAKFILFLFLCAQYLVQVGKATKSAPGVPALFRRLLTSLEALQFAGLSIPAECLDAPPFFTEMAQMYLALACLGVLAFLTFIWGFASWTLAAAGVSRCSRQTPPLPEAHKVKAKHAIVVVLRNPATYRKLASVIIAVVFALVCNACLGVLKCDARAPMRVSVYLSLSNDRSAMLRAGIICGSSNPDCTGLITSTDILLRVIEVSVVSKYPNIVCGEAEHRAAQLLALITLIVIGAALPICSFAGLTSRLYHSASASKTQVMLRVPCSQWRQSPCVRCATKCAGKSSKPDSIKVSSRSSEQSAGAGPGVDSPECIAELDQDQYFGPIASTEFLPSSFYFMQLNWVVALSLSISLTYLGGNGDAWWRLILNSVSLLGILALIHTTNPYRKEEAFSSRIQTSLLVVAYLVTLTGVAGSLSLTNTSTSSAANAGNMTAVAESNNGSSVSTMAASSVQTTRHNSSAQFASTSLAYITLAAMGIVGFWLLVSFFQALRSGAESEDGEHKNKRSFVSKFGKLIGKSRAIAYSLSAVLRKRGANPHLPAGQTALTIRANTSARTVKSPLSIGDSVRHALAFSPSGVKPRRPQDISSNALPVGPGPKPHPKGTVRKFMRPVAADNSADPIAQSFEEAGDAVLQKETVASASAPHGLRSAAISRRLMSKMPSSRGEDGLPGGPADETFTPTLSRPRTTRFARSSRSEGQLSANLRAMVANATQTSAATQLPDVKN